MGTSSPLILVIAHTTNGYCGLSLGNPSNRLSNALRLEMSPLRKVDLSVSFVKADNDSRRIAA